jgi:lipopolysaccharide transport system ATP-binding protein
MATAIEFEHVSKQYRLGLVSTKTLSHDIRRFWITNVLGKEDPYLKIGETNDRASKGNSEYVWALRDIDFKVDQGDVVGIIGKNGAGKSTLLKLLSRVTGPTTGTIRAHGRIGSLLEVGTGFHGEMTGRENIFMNGAILGMSRAEIQSKLDEIIDFSGCERYIDTPVKRYSSGMTVRLGFAVAAFLEPEILVVDEVLAVGDAEFQKKAIGKMKDVSQGQGRTVLFVSHNMASIRALCNHGVLLEKGQVKFMGDVNDTVDMYMQSNLQSYGDKTILETFVPLVNGIKIEEFTINGQEGNQVTLEWPNRSLDICIKGHYDGKANLDLESYIFSNNQYLIAKRTPALSTGKTISVNNEDFVIKDRIVLPDGFTNGQYFMKFDLTHPKVHTIATADMAVELNISGNYTPQGIPVDSKYFGALYL